MNAYTFGGVTRYLILALTVVTVTACTNIPEQFQNAPQLEGRSEAYTEGFYDGVRSGRHITGNYLTFHTLEAQRYRTEQQYTSHRVAGL